MSRGHISWMGNRAPVHRTIQNCSIYLQGVYPNNTARLPNHGRGAGGEHSAGPVGLLSGLNPQPNHLVKHFFSVALFGMTRLPLRKGLYGIWLAFMLLVTAVNIILPIINSEGIRRVLHMLLLCRSWHEPRMHCNSVTGLKTSIL